MVLRLLPFNKGVKAVKVKAVGLCDVLLGPFAPVALMPWVCFILRPFVALVLVLIWKVVVVVALFVTEGGVVRAPRRRGVTRLQNPRACHHRRG